MRRVIMLAVLPGLAMGGTAHAADDNDGTKIDCSGTDFEFKDPDFEVECTDLGRSAVNLDEGLAGDRIKKLFAIRQTGGVTFLLALDQSVLGSRVYMRRGELKDQISRTFTQVVISDWNPANNASGFDTATFTGNFDNGSQLECRAFRREMNRRYEGVGRRVFGIVCTSRGDSEALATLAKLDAPGK